MKNYNLVIIVLVLGNFLNFYMTFYWNFLLNKKRKIFFLFA